MLYTDVVNESPRCPGIPLATHTGEENLTNQCFVDDTVLLAGEPTFIISQIDGYNSQAAIWGTILNLHKTRIISNRSLDPIKEWMNRNEIHHDGSKSKLYLGVWISIHNDTWNTHYTNVIAKARKALFHLKSLGLDRWCMPMEKTVNILKKLIFTKISFAAEITTPSIAVINKVDRFLAEAIKMTTQIPWETPDEVVLWEAGMQDFTTQLQLAKFRFHHKMSSSKCSQNKSQSYYIQGNYLYDHILPQITQAFGNLDSEEYKKKINQSKESWKNYINKAIRQNQIQRKRASGTTNFNMKPTPEYWPLIQTISTIYQKEFLRARLDVWSRTETKCACGIEIISPRIHIFFDCENEEIIMKRRTLWVLVAMLAPESIKQSTKITKMLWLLGKQTTKDEESNNLQQLCGKTAELIHEAAKLFN
jgi:hypothetical protein